MINKIHPDFLKYKNEFEQIKKNMQKDFNNITINKNHMDNEETSAIHRKYARQIKLLQKKYSYLFLAERQ